MASQSTDQSVVDHDDTTAELTEQEDQEELSTKSDMVDPSSVLGEFLKIGAHVKSYKH